MGQSRSPLGLAALVVLEQERHTPLARMAAALSIVKRSCRGQVPAASYVTTRPSPPHSSQPPESFTPLYQTGLPSRFTAPLSMQEVHVSSRLVERTRTDLW